MSEMIVYECPECGDRKLIQHNQSGLHPQMWCNCEGFVTMEVEEYDA